MNRPQVAVTAKRRRPSQRPEHDPRHPVRFYAKDASMMDQVARFLRPGAEAGECALVIATGPHIEGLRQRLPGLPIRFLDAQETLAGFIRGGRLDPDLFDAVVGEVVRKAAGEGNGRVRAFGEMVALLAQEGRHGLALELEAQWNRLAGTVPLTLMCAYPMHVFQGPGADSLAQVCAAHDDVQSEARTDDQPSLTSLPSTGEPGLLDFIENGPIGMHQVDGDGKILWVNRYELDLLGYRLEEYLGHNIRDFHADPRIFDEIVAANLRGHVVHAKRATLRRKDGTPLPVLIGSLGTMKDGQLAHRHCTVRPVLAVEAAYQEVLESLTTRERQQACIARLGQLALRPGKLDDLFHVVCREIVDATGADTCNLLQLDADGTRLHLRAGVGFPAGYDPAIDATAGSHGDFILRSGQPVLYRDLAAETRFRPSPHLLENGVRGGMSVPVHTAAGAWGTIGLHRREVRDFTQDDVNFLEAVSHVIGSAIERHSVVEDLEASRARLEAVVHERTQRLEQANRELDAFTSAVSHDLRGPVRAIAGFSALLAQRHAGRLDPHGRELLEEVRRAAARMGDLIEDLLDLSRADRVLPNRTAVDLTTMATEILRAEAERSPNRHVHCEVEPDLVVQGDADLLRMALENLLANAWKFTARAQDARISVSKRREGEEVVLCVQDNGAGFDMADAGRLFQPFQRLHKRSEYEGTGIGLATVRRIIERHGGRIWVQAKPGAGAAFYFTLPGAV